MPIGARTRILTTVLVAIGVALALAPAGASAGEYRVAQCDGAQRTHPDARFERGEGPYYRIRRHCGSADGGRALKLDNLVATPVGRSAGVSWQAPAGSSIIGVGLEARLRSDAGHRARLRFVDSDGDQAGLIATGGKDRASFERHGKRLEGAGRDGFAARLACTTAGGCARSPIAHAWIRNVRLHLRDASPPRVELGGELLTGGWVRGARALVHRISDRGSGLRRLSASVNGRRIDPTATLPCATLGAGTLAARMRPCPADRSGSSLLETAEPPFRDGVNSLRLCAADFGAGANRSCVRRRVAIDNTAPTAAFVAPRAADPELITARISDRHSGLAGAEISYRRRGEREWIELPSSIAPGVVRARVDSSAQPPGSYEFRIAGADRAGNGFVSTTRADGSPMVLRFPLRERTRVSVRSRLRGHAYGSRPRVSGLLRARGADGRTRPLGRQRVRIVERFAAGSRPPRRVRTVRTGADGRFALRLGRGPSRRLAVRFAGSRRFLPARSAGRKLVVAGRVRLRSGSRRVGAGRRVRFRGKVGMLGVAAGGPGRVVELQAREAGRGRFRTVGHALHADERGRVSTAYRFGRFYRRPVRFQFRLKLTRQPAWPYRAPTYSPTRTLTVRPR